MRGCCVAPLHPRGATESRLVNVFCAALLLGRIPALHISIWCFRGPLFPQKETKRNFWKSQHKRLLGAIVRHENKNLDAYSGVHPRVSTLIQPNFQKIKKMPIFSPTFQPSLPSQNPTVSISLFVSPTTPTFYQKLCFSFLLFFSYFVVKRFFFFFPPFFF